MASACSARRRCCWEHPRLLPLPAAAVSAARDLGLWAFIPTMATADTGPITATKAFAMRFGSASRRATAGEYAASRSASDCDDGRPQRPTPRPPLSCRLSGAWVRIGRDPLSAAVPYVPDRGLGPARAEAAAVPAPSIKAGAAVPVDWPAIPRLFPFDPLGGAVAGQEAVAVPVTRHMPLSMRRRSNRCRGRQQQGCNRDRTEEIS